jgi:hypothetical protein
MIELQEGIGGKEVPGAADVVAFRECDDIRIFHVNFRGGWAERVVGELAVHGRRYVASRVPWRGTARRFGLTYRLCRKRLQGDKK